MCRRAKHRQGDASTLLMGAMLLGGCNDLFEITKGIPTPEVCVLNSDCTSGFRCINQHCSPPCKTNRDCPIGDTCVEDAKSKEHGCVSPALGTGGAIGEAPGGQTGSVGGALAVSGASGGTASVDQILSSGIGNKSAGGEDGANFSLGGSRFGDGSGGNRPSSMGLDAGSGFVSTSIGGLDVKAQESVGASAPETYSSGADGGNGNVATQVDMTHGGSVGGIPSSILPTTGGDSSSSSSLSTGGSAGTATTAATTAGAAGQSSVPALNVTGIAPFATDEHERSVILDIELTATPSSDVSVSIASSDTTEGTVDRAALTFTKDAWTVRQRVTVTGVGDWEADGDVSYQVTLRSTSLDTRYAQLSPTVLQFINHERGVFHGIGDLPGGAYSSAANDVSADGNVVVGRGSDEGGDRAIRWTPAGDLVGLEGTDSYAMAVSPNGKLVVGSATYSGKATAAIWREGVWSPVLNGAVACDNDPSTMAPAYWPTSANDVNDDEFIVGGASLFNAGVCATAIPLGYYTHGGTGSFPPAHLSAVSSLAPVSIVGTLWKKRGTNCDSAYINDTEVTLPNPSCVAGCSPYCSTQANGVSSDGTLVVGSATFYPETILRGVLWSSTSGAYLPDLEGGTVQGAAYGINGDASLSRYVAVGRGTDDVRTRAVVWVNGKVLSIEDALLREEVTVPAGWTLGVARAVSVDGRVIVGQGVNPNGQVEGWRAILPNISTFSG